MERVYDLEQLGTHWETLIFQLCSTLAVYHLTTEEPTDEVVEKLNVEDVINEANNVLNRAVVAAEMMFDDSEEGEVN